MVAQAGPSLRNIKDSGRDNRKVDDFRRCSFGYSSRYRSGIDIQGQTDDCFLALLIICHKTKQNKKGQDIQGSCRGRGIYQNARAESTLGTQDQTRKRLQRLCKGPRDMAQSSRRDVLESSLGPQSRASMRDWSSLDHCEQSCKYAGNSASIKAVGTCRFGWEGEL